MLSSAEALLPVDKFPIFLFVCKDFEVLLFLFLFEVSFCFTFKLFPMCSDVKA